MRKPGAFVPILASVLLACAGEEAPPPSEQQAGELPTEPPPAAVRAAAMLVDTLMARVVAAMETRGPAGAVTFCSEEALPLTRAVEAAAGHGISLKRTSRRYRNPANAPDLLEMAALDSLHALEDTGTALPSHILQRTPEGLRYYRPLRMAEPCLKCHGSADELAPGVAEALAIRYPQDRATGYAAGDLRGVIRVGMID